MTNLTHIPPAQSHRDAIRRSGFDLDDPQRRHPVHNLELDRLRAQVSPQRDSRADQLLRARQGLDKERVRGLAWFALPGLGLLAPEQTKASVPVDVPPVIAPIDFPMPGVATATALPDPTIEAALHLPPLTDPIWSLVLLGTLTLTTALSLVTLQRLSRHLRKVFPMNAQLPLFKVHELPHDPAADPQPDLSSRNFTAWRVDGASRTGLVRKENQDAFATWNRPGTGPVLVLCDGAGGVEGGKQAAEQATFTIMASLKKALEDPAAGPDIRMLERALEEARANAKDQKLTGVTTAIVVAACGERLFYATVGDGALAVTWPDGMVTHLLAPHHTAGMPSNVINAYIGGDCDIPARIGEVRLEPGSTVMLMSDGAGDLFPFDAFGLAHDQQLAAWRDNGVLADRLLGELEAARDPDTDAYLHHDNMTLVAAHYNVLEVHDV